MIAVDEKIPAFNLVKRAVNADSFIEFLHFLKRKHGAKPMALYMDNLRVHNTIAVRKVYEDLKIKPIFSPPYQPELNPIEFVFSQLKLKVKKMRLKDMLTKKPRPYTELVPLAISKLSVENVN